MPKEFGLIKLKCPKLYGIFVDYIVAFENPLQELKNINQSKVLHCLKFLGKNIDEVEKEKPRFKNLKDYIIPQYLQFVIEEGKLKPLDVHIALDLFKFYENLPNERIKS